MKSTPYLNDGGEVLGRVVELSCIAKQKNLEFENEFLQDEFRASFGNTIGHSPALQKVLAQIATVATTEFSFQFSVVRFSHPAMRVLAGRGP